MGYKALALNDNEEVMIELRKHVLALARSLIGFLALSGLVIFLYSVTGHWCFLLVWFWFALFLCFSYPLVYVRIPKDSLARASLRNAKWRLRERV